MNDPEKQRISIAEACGWTDIRHDEIEGVDVDAREIYSWSGLRGMNPDKKHRHFIPDYFHDLNAMHEAEKVLYRDSKLSVKYVWIISETMQLPAALWSNQRTKFVLMHATAAERAEAFLRTLGKWEEGK